MIVTSRTTHMTRNMWTSALMRLPKQLRMVKYFRLIGSNYTMFSVYLAFGDSQRGVNSIDRNVLWEQLFSDFDLFEDCRAAKSLRGGNGPDFKRKVGGQGLWWETNCSDHCIWHHDIWVYLGAVAEHQSVTLSIKFQLHTQPYEPHRSPATLYLCLQICIHTP